MLRLARLLSLVILVVLPTAAHAADSGFAFLRLPVSARSGALGETGASFLEGASSWHPNPAGLADTAGQATSSAPWHVAGEAALAHHEAFGNLRQDAAVVRIAKGAQGFAIAFNTLYSEDVEETDAAGNPIGSFGLSNFQIEGQYARYVGSGWRFGAGLAYVTERIANDRASTWTARFGARWDVPAVRGLSLGATVRNLGGDARYSIDGADGESVSAPLTVQGGASYALSFASSTTLRLAAEARGAQEDDVVGLGGAELAWQALALRAGTRLGTDVGHFTAGLGIATGSFRLDYAFLPSGEDLGDSHRFELTAAFGL